MVKTRSGNNGNNGERKEIKKTIEKKTPKQKNESKKAYKTYTEEALKLAIDDVKSERLSYRLACAKYKIPGRDLVRSVFNTTETLVQPELKTRSGENGIDGERKAIKKTIEKKTSKQKNERKEANETYTQETLKIAIDDIKSKRLSYREAAAKYKISYPLLKTIIHVQSTRETLAQPETQERELSDEEEIDICGVLTYMAETMMIPVDIDQIKHKVNGFLQSVGREIESRSFNDNFPDDDWCAQFIGRHKDVFDKIGKQDIPPYNACVTYSGCLKKHKTWE